VTIYEGQDTDISSIELFVTVSEELKKAAVYHHGDRTWWSDERGVSESSGTEDEIEAETGQDDG
jgi:hypothetical protein